MPEILEGISRGGIFVVRDKGFINHVLEARKADRDQRLEDQEVFDVRATHQGWNSIRFAILKEVPDHSRIPVMDELVIVKPKTGVDFLEEDKERRVKIAQLQPVAMSFRRHRPPFRKREETEPEDFAVEIGLVSDFEYPFEAWEHVHGQNRSTLLWTYRDDNCLDEDGVEVDQKKARQRPFFGRLHDCLVVVSTAPKQLFVLGPGDVDTTTVKKVSCGDRAKKGEYRGAFNWSHAGTSAGEKVTDRFQLNPNGVKTAKRIWHPGGWVYESETEQVANIKSVFFFGGVTDSDDKNYDDQMRTLLDIRHDAHFVRDDADAETEGGSSGAPAAPNVPNHQDGRLYFTSMPPAKDLVGLSSGRTRDYIGYLCPDKKVANTNPLQNNQGGTSLFSEVKGDTVKLGPGSASDQKHETVNWRPQIPIEIETGNKPNTYIPTGGGAHGSGVNPPNVNTGSIRREVYGPAGDAAKGVMLPNLNPRQNAPALRFRLEASLTAAIGTTEIKVRFKYQIINNGGDIHPAFTTVNVTLDSTDVPAGFDKKFNIDLDIPIASLAFNDVLNIEFHRDGDDLGDTFAGDLEVMEESWHYA